MGAWRLCPRVDCTRYAMCSASEVYVLFAHVSVCVWALCEVPQLRECAREGERRGLVPPYVSCASRGASNGREACAWRASVCARQNAAAPAAACVADADDACLESAWRGGDACSVAGSRM